MRTFRSTRRGCWGRGLIAGAAAAFAAFGVVACSNPADTGASAPNLPARVKDALHQALVTTSKATATPGVIVGVWEGGKRPWTAVRGVASTATKRPPVLGETTRIGSITKTFTGTLILQLVKDHELSLDQTVGRWFPDMPDGDKITVRMLGNMSSGIASYTTDPTWQEQYFSNPHRVWTPQELVKIGLALPRLDFAPGHGFDYSNTNTVMLGLIVQDVTKEPFAKALDQMILHPLGLTGTRYPATNRLPRPHWQGYTTQGQPDGTVVNATTWSPSFGSAAGQMFSTLKDLHRWSVELGTGSLLTPALQKERLMPNPATAHSSRVYAFAVGVDNGWITHAGSLPGYNTVVSYLPTSRTAIVVMANTDTGSPAAKIWQALAAVVAPHHVPSQPVGG